MKAIHHKDGNPRNNDPANLEVVSIARNFSPAGDSYEATLCELWSGEHDNRANAALIVAAPTMYQELLDTDEALTKLINDLCNFVDKPSMAIVEEWQRSVRTTLAKARGETP